MYRISIHLIGSSIFRLNTDPDPGFWWPKIGKKLQMKKYQIFFWSKIAIYLSLGLHKGRPSYRRSLQPSKENIQHFKTPDPDLDSGCGYGSTDLIESGSNPDPKHCLKEWIRIQSGSETLFKGNVRKIFSNGWKCYFARYKNLNNYLRESKTLLRTQSDERP